MTMRRLLDANETAERRAKLEEYFLLLMKAKAAGKKLSDTYGEDLVTVGKKLGQHGARIVITSGAQKLVGWIDRLLG